jgi:AcrR family transcriptional regulator
VAKIVDAEEKRAHIVDATWRVVAEHGLDVATMRMIAAEAGCTTGMVTHYFANKDEILEELVEQVSRQSGRRLSAAIEGHVGVAALRELLVQSLPLDAERNAQWRVWLALWNRSVAGGQLADEWARRNRVWMKLLRTTVEKAVAYGDIPPSAARESDIEALSALSFGLSMAAILPPRRLSKRAMVRTVDDYLEARYGAFLAAVEDSEQLTGS